MEKYLDVLKKAALFANMQDSEILGMMSCLGAVSKNYAKKSMIRLEGDAANFIGIVLDGKIQIFQDDYSGKRSIMASFGPGQMFAEAFACAGVAEMPVNVLAETDCVILFLDHNRILHQCQNACAHHAKLIENLLQIVARKNIMLNQKLRYISHKTTGEKIMAYLNDQAKLHHSSEFTIPFDRQGLADYLGVERSAMSAEISKLQKQGLLETNRSYFKILPEGTHV